MRGFDDGAFLDVSPPLSPKKSPRPAVQIREPPRPVERHQKMEHRRWKSDSDHSRLKVAPYSYEYKWEDGGLVSLAEYHPDDYEHYSASRNTSRSVSRNQSTRTSRDNLASRENKGSTTSHGTNASLPPSPRLGHVLKKALSLHGLKGRASSVDETRRQPPSPSTRPDIQRLAASFGSSGPHFITSPLPSLPEPKPVGQFEEPRAAPVPPPKSSLRPRRRPEPLQEISFNQYHSRNRSRGESPLKTSSTNDTTSLTPPGTATSSSSSAGHSLAGSASPSSRPLLRKKTSSNKFIEHIEAKAKLQAEPPVASRTQDDVPPVPPLYIPSAEIHMPLATTSSSTSPSPELVPAKPDPQELPPAPRPTPSAALKRSSSTMKSLPPTPGPLPKRSMSTHARAGAGARPSPIAMDIRMARITPVLRSPVVAKGHARMISC